MRADHAATIDPHTPWAGRRYVLWAGQRQPWYKRLLIRLLGLPSGWTPLHYTNNYQGALSLLQQVLAVVPDPGVVLSIQEVRETWAGTSSHNTRHRPFDEPKQEEDGHAETENQA